MVYVLEPTCLYPQHTQAGLCWLFHGTWMVVGILGAESRTKLRESQVFTQTEEPDYTATANDHLDKWIC
jgi:hypothetical protein